jgi:hypothetical protein
VAKILPFVAILSRAEDERLPRVPRAVHNIDDNIIWVQEIAKAGKFAGFARKFDFFAPFRLSGGGKMAVVLEWVDRSGHCERCAGIDAIQRP